MDKLKDIETKKNIADSLHNLARSYETISLENATEHFIRGR